MGSTVQFQIHTCRYSLSFSSSRRREARTGVGAADTACLSEFQRYHYTPLAHVVYCSQSSLTIPLSRPEKQGLIRHNPDENLAKSDSQSKARFCLNLSRIPDLFWTVSGVPGGRYSAHSEVITQLNHPMLGGNPFPWVGNIPSHGEKPECCSRWHGASTRSGCDRPQYL